MSVKQHQQKPLSDKMRKPDRKNEWKFWLKTLYYKDIDFVRS